MPGCSALTWMRASSEFGVGDVGLALLGAALEDGELLAALVVERGLLRGLAILGFGHVARLAGDVEAVANLGRIECQQQLAGRDILVGLYDDALDHAVEWRAHDGRLERDDLGRRQHRLAHRNPHCTEHQHGDRHRDPAVAPQQRAPGAQATAAVERRPGMAVGVGDLADQPGIAFLPRRIARQQQRAAHLAAAGQRHQQGVGRQPFAPVLGQIRRQVGSGDRKGAPVLALAVERRQHALEPDREGRVACDHRRAGDGQHATGARRVASPQRGLPIGHQPVRLVDGEEGQLLDRTGMTGAVRELGQQAERCDLGLQQAWVGPHLLRRAAHGGVIRTRPLMPGIRSRASPSIVPVTLIDSLTGSTRPPSSSTWAW